MRALTLVEFLSLGKVCKDIEARSTAFRSLVPPDVHDRTKSLKAFLLQHVPVSFILLTNNAVLDAGGTVLKLYEMFSSSLVSLERHYLSKEHFKEVQADLC
jgi:hypothetical protein